MCFGHCVIWFASSLLGHEWRGGELVFSPESLGQVSAVIAPSPPLSSGPSLSPAWWFMATRGTLLIAPLLPLLVSILFLSSLNIADSRNTCAVAIGDKFCGPPAWRRISVQFRSPFSALMPCFPSDFRRKPFSERQSRLSHGGALGSWPGFSWAGPFACRCWRAGLDWSNWRS